MFIVFKHRFNFKMRVKYKHFTNEAASISIEYIEIDVFCLYKILMNVMVTFYIYNNQWLLRLAFLVRYSIYV